jgi:hypothetical protein
MLKRMLVFVTVLVLCMVGVGSAESVVLGSNIPGQAYFDVVALSCDNTGSTISLDGEITLNGLSVVLTFQNNLRAYIDMTRSRAWSFRYWIREP